MGVLSEATKAIKDFKKPNKYPYKKEAEWEDSNLNELKKYAEYNANISKKRLKTSTDEEKNKVYRADIEGLKKVKAEIQKKRAANLIKKRSDNASYTSDKVSRRLKKRDLADDILEG